MPVKHVSTYGIKGKSGNCSYRMQIEFSSVLNYTFSFSLWQIVGMTKSETVPLT